MIPAEKVTYLMMINRISDTFEFLRCKLFVIFFLAVKPTYFYTARLSNYKTAAVFLLKTSQLTM